ncbi:PREDICTED: uncharacterized protein LOC109581813 [Amphimedon queenslandica]|uniref:Uncharacterized protein n=1 Tax=Amphimedon queenslandica TaxID=400682 RepID=A0A1X7UX64_AMPQE|nr:PREDICTED: uncharacterized protein LOC109581813 [Amphimedon queenslandica]|eukprot:XP_019851777.1 PREDICTED: uncharacterized protein LOC109581813 [Amphimedon queenslandica]
MIKMDTSDVKQLQMVELMLQVHVRINFQTTAVEQEINLDVNENWDKLNRFCKDSNGTQDIEQTYKDVHSQYEAYTEDGIEVWEITGEQEQGIEEEVEEIQGVESECLEEETGEDQEEDCKMEQEKHEDNVDDSTKGEKEQQKGKPRMGTKLVPTRHQHIASKTNGCKGELKKSSNKYSKHQKVTDVYRPDKTIANNYHESFYTDSHIGGYEYNSKRSILVTGIPIRIHDPNWLSQLFKEQSYCHKKEMFIGTSTRLAYTPYNPCVETTSLKQDPSSDLQLLQLRKY